jgi:hypothetical protein
MAQRDTAERALGFFVGLLGDHLFGSSCSAVSGDAGLAVGDSATAGIDAEKLPPEVANVASFCRELIGDDGAAVNWSLHWDGGMCQANVQFPMCGVRHQFGGPFCAAIVDAYRETARRVLWYLGRPGYEDAFVPDLSVVGPDIRALPCAPPNWAAGTEEIDAIEDAERKTAVMRLQNRLQLAFASSILPGQQVWEWEFESSCPGGLGDTLVKATVDIPSLGRKFSSVHVPVVRTAQIELCAVVNAYLDSEGYL